MTLRTVPEAAKLLTLKESTIRFWIWTRRIEFVKVGRRAVRIPDRAIREIIERGTVPARRD